MSASLRKYTCSICGHNVWRRDTANLKDCPKCGKANWLGKICVPDTATVIDEQNLQGTKTNNKLVLERVQKTDLNSSASVAVDAGKPSKITVKRKKRVEGFDEEAPAAEALANSYNKLRGTNYRVVPKLKEDNGSVDRELTSESSDPRKLNIQIRNLDSEIIASVGKQGDFDGERTAADIVRSICTAIKAKSNVDSKLKSETILQLIIPAPLGEGFRRTIETHAFEFRGYREVWISPFHEENFPLNSTSEADCSRTYTLEELVDGITEENLHGEIDSGPPIGNKVW